MIKNKNIIIGLITGLAAFHFQISIATAEATSLPIPINSPEAKKLLAPYEKLLKENPVEAERIKQLAIQQKAIRDMRTKNIEQFAAQFYTPEMPQLALIEYYREEQRREKLEAAKPKPQQPEELESYDKLSSEDKKAVSLAAYRSYQQAHATGSIGLIHGDAVQQEFNKFRNPHIPYTNRFGKDNRPGMHEILYAIDLLKVGVKLPMGLSVLEMDEFFMRNRGKPRVQVKIPDDLSDDLQRRYYANLPGELASSIDERYKEHKDEFMERLLKNPPDPAMANKWIIDVRNNIAHFGLQGARDAYRRNQGGVPDPKIVANGNDWCDSIGKNNNLLWAYAKPNQLGSCDVAHAASPTLVLRDRPDISVVMDIQPNTCTAVIPTKIQSSNKNDFRDESILGKVIAWAQITVSTACPNTTAIKLIGIVNGQIIYQGIAARANRWALSEIGGEESIFPAHINWSATLNPITSTDQLLRLGEQYAYGKGVPRDDKKAVELFHSAAEKGNPEAQYKLAVMLEQGHGISQDFKSAFDWYSKAAKQGHAGARNNIGIMYEKGLGMPKNPKEAFTWYRMAAAGGLGLAHYNLGNAYFKGTGVKQDTRSAFSYFRMAESLGVSEATEKLKEVESSRSSNNQD